jgi:hypothetical protein
MLGFFNLRIRKHYPHWGSTPKPKITLSILSQHVKKWNLCNIRLFLPKYKIQSSQAITDREERFITSISSFCPFMLGCWYSFIGRNGCKTCETLFFADTVVPSNRVISSPFSHRTFFFTKFHEGTLYFFLAVNSLKKWFRCWHGHFWPWLTSKPLFFYSSSGDEITLLEGNFVSHIYLWTKTWIWTPSGNFFSCKFFVKNLGTHTKW